MAVGILAPAWHGAKNIGNKVLSVCRGSRSPDILGDLPILSRFLAFSPRPPDICKFPPEFINVIKRKKC